MCQPARSETQKSAIQLTINDGMSQSTVNDILQADDGRMWFATGDGLSLYDGESFQYVYRAQPDAPGLANNYTFALAQDTNGLIWVGTLGGGIAVFDQQVNPVASLRAASGLFASDEVFDLAPGPDGTMWIADALGQRVLHVAQGGEVLDQLDFDFGVFACGLGGSDGRTLFVCAAPDFNEHQRKIETEGKLLAVRV